MTIELLMAVQIHAQKLFELILENVNEHFMLFLAG